MANPAQKACIESLRALIQQHDEGTLESPADLCTALINAVADLRCRTEYRTRQADWAPEELAAVENFSVAAEEAAQ